MPSLIVVRTHYSLHLSIYVGVEENSIILGYSTVFLINICQWSGGDKCFKSNYEVLDNESKRQAFLQIWTLILNSGLKRI